MKDHRNIDLVTCLSTAYKTYTSIIGQKNATVYWGQNLMPKKQKVCFRGSKGCKDQLLISKAILQECKSRKKNLCVAWTEYQKLLYCTTQPDKRLLFTVNTISYWKIKSGSMCRREKNKKRSMGIQCAICEGNSLIPLLLCVGITTLT
jgi:hypothetical protein